jgi:bifunctional non-homologous end joining protein LigD
MQVEDHPLEYGAFEGVIPEGYGAGVVMLWDQGTWTPESADVDAALAKGDMKFRLEGYKLKGSWALVRTRGYGGGSKPSWLLIKHKDEWSGPIDITEFAPLSVKTPDADLADILAADTPAVWRSNPPAKTGDTGKLFQRIIATALELRANAHTDQPTRLMSSAKAAQALAPEQDAPTPAAKTRKRAASPKKRKPGATR